MTDKKLPKENSDKNFLQAIEATNNALSMITGVLGDLKSEFVEFGDNQNNLTKRVDNLELSYEITTAQSDNIKNNVRDLATKLVGYPSYIYGVTIADIYRYLRRNYNLASRVGRTEKRYYESVVKGLSTYESTQFNKQRLIEHKKNLDIEKTGKNYFVNN